MPITVKPCNNGFEGNMQGCLLLLKSALLKHELKEINGSKANFAMKKDFPLSFSIIVGLYCQELS